MNKRITAQGSSRGFFILISTLVPHPGSFFWFHALVLLSGFPHPGPTPWSLILVPHHGSSPWLHILVPQPGSTPWFHILVLCPGSSRWFLTLVPNAGSSFSATARDLGSSSSLPEAPRCGLPSWPPPSIVLKVSNHVL